MLKRKRIRRSLGALLVIAGALLMWLAPEPIASRLSFIGIVLLVAGIALEVIGITLERRDRSGDR